MCAITQRDASALLFTSDSRWRALAAPFAIQYSLRCASPTALRRPRNPTAAAVPAESIICSNLIEKGGGLSACVCMCVQE